MAMFNQMGGGSPFGGAQGGASAFTSPGLDPMTLAMLLRMQGNGMGGALGGMQAGGQTMGMGGMPQPGGPQMPQVPQGIGAGAAIPHPPVMSGANGGSATPNPAPMAGQMSNLMGLQQLLGQQGGQGGGLADMLRSLFGGQGNAMLGTNQHGPAYP